MASGKPQRIQLDLNCPVFQRNLFELDKSQRHEVLNTLLKLSQLDWHQLYRDQGLKWEKIHSVVAPPGFDTIYSLRISQSRRAAAVCQENFLRLISIAPDHDATYGKK